MWLTAIWKNNFRFQLDFMRQSVLSGALLSLMSSIPYVQIFYWVYGIILQTWTMNQMWVWPPNPPAPLSDCKSWERLARKHYLLSSFCRYSEVTCEPTVLKFAAFPSPNSILEAAPWHLQPLPNLLPSYSSENIHLMFQIDWLSTCF